MTKKAHIKSPEIIECYKLLEECISLEHIEDKVFICKNINLVKDYQRVMSQEVYTDIENFITNVIRPIVYDLNYFDFLKKSQYGSYNERRHFVVNSDSSLEMIIFLKYHHMLSLKDKLQNMMSKYM